MCEFSGVVLPSGSRGVVGYRMLPRPAVERRAAVLAAADDVFLLLQRRAVPALHEIADDAHHLVGAADRPLRLALALPGPDDALHQRRIAGIGIGGAVAEAEEVAGARRRAVGHRMHHRHVALLLPAQHHGFRHGLQDVAQRMDVGVLRVRAELQHQVAVAEVGLERVVREFGHPFELARLQRLQPRAVVEERRAERHRDRQVVRLDLRPEDAGIGRRQLRVALRHGAAVHQEGDPLRQCLEQRLEFRRAVGDDVEGGDDAGGRSGRHHACLMDPVERLALARVGMPCRGIRHPRIRVRLGRSRRHRAAGERTARCGAEAHQQPPPVGDESLPRPRVRTRLSRARLVVVHLSALR